MNKQNMKNILKMMIFLCLVITLLHLSSRIVEPKQNTKESGIKYENARGFYGERQNSLDIIAIGNSDLYNAMNPLQLWHEQGIPSLCPSCHSKRIGYYGTGTEKVETELKELLPTARILRMDVDTTRKKGAHEKILRQFVSIKSYILLGTKMIANGLDFPNVT